MNFTVQSKHALSGFYNSHLTTLVFSCVSLTLYHSFIHHIFWCKAASNVHINQGYKLVFVCFFLRKKMSYDWMHKLHVEFLLMPSNAHICVTQTWIALWQWPLSHCRSAPALPSRGSHHFFSTVRDFAWFRTTFHWTGYFKFFSVRLLSYSIKNSRFTHVVFAIIRSFLWLGTLLHVWAQINQFIPFPVDIHLYSFPFGATVKEATMSICAQVYRYV